MHYGQQMISRQIDMLAFPFALLKNPDGTWTQTAAKSGYAAFAEGTSWQEDNRLEVANTTTFNFEFVPEVFKVSADVTYKGARWTRDRMENLYTYYTGVNVSGQDNSYSSLENWNYISNYISTNIVGTLTPKLGRDHDLNVVAGWNLEDYDYRAQKTYRQGNRTTVYRAASVTTGRSASSGRINYATTRPFRVGRFKFRPCGEGSSLERRWAGASSGRQPDVEDETRQPESRARASAVRSATYRSAWRPWFYQNDDGHQQRLDLSRRSSSTVRTCLRVGFPRLGSEL